LLPVGAFSAARWLNIAGGVLAIALYVWERTNRRANAAAPATPAVAAGPTSALKEDERAFLDRMGVRGTGEGE
jgi:hypothetical protein